MVMESNDMQFRVSGNTRLNHHHVSLQLLQDYVAVLCQVSDTIVQISFVSIVFVFLASTVTKRDALIHTHASSTVLCLC
jgi:hypothetical protein